MGHYFIIKCILKDFVGNYPNFGKYFYFRNGLKVRHPNAARFVAILMIIVGNSLIKHDISSYEAFIMITDYMMQCQNTEGIVPTFADIDEVFDDPVLRKIMKTL